MERRWNIPDSAFALSLQFYQNALDLIRELGAAKSDGVTDDRIRELQELSQLLQLEWRRSFPIEHQQPTESLTMPILN